MDRLTAEEALAHPYMADYSFPLDEPVSLHPFHIEDEVDDILLMDQSHSHTWDRYTLSPITSPTSVTGLREAKFFFPLFRYFSCVSLVSVEDSLLCSLITEHFSGSV